MEHSTAYNMIRGAILKARLRSETKATAHLNIFRLFPWEKVELKEMGYTFYYSGAGYLLCDITWENKNV